MRLDADQYSFDHEDLTPEERALFAALPRERLGSAALEARVVRALAAQQLLGRRQRFVLGARHVAGLVAAALVLFVTGFAAGRSSATVNRQAAVARVDSAQLGRLVQRAGSEYVRLLERIPVADSGDPRAAVNQAARSTLRAAAKQIARVDPTDPVASVILEELATVPQDPRGAQRIWF